MDRVNYPFLNSLQENVRRNTLTLPGGIYNKPIWGVWLNRDGGLIWVWGLVSVLHKELKYKVEKHKHKTF